MSQADRQYSKIALRILNSGISDNDYNVRPKWSDGKPAYTKSIISQKFRFDNSEIPILTQKRVAWKTAIKELLWIWVQRTSSVDELNKAGVTIWDEWKLKDGTIGKAYGYQLSIPCRNLNGNKVNQVEYLLHELKNNPASRRIITTLWNINDLDEMALTPCVWTTQWYVKKGKLSLEVNSRSGDYFLGIPFNIFQYNVLQRMVAQVTGYKLGDYIFNVGDCHIYDRHEASVKQQLLNEEFQAPELWINPEIKNFDDFTIKDFRLKNYQNSGDIKCEVAI